MPARVTQKTSPNRIPPQSQINGHTCARLQLEQRYQPLFEERLAYRQLVTYVPNKAIPIHRWFKFPQGFSPHLVELMLKELDVKPADRIFDPFCGCGTTLVAAKQRGYSSWGIDILPVAVFATKVKLRDAADYDLGALRRGIDQLLSADYRAPTMQAPADINIVEKGYDHTVLDKIMFFNELILQQQDEKVRSFLLLGLMSILETLSFTSKDGQFLRLKPHKRIPSVRLTLKRKLNLMYDDLVPLQPFLFRPSTDTADHRADAYVRMADARCFTEQVDDYADVVITSPPYLNRYDYSRIFSLELCLNDCKEFEDLKAVRHSLLRSHIESREAPTEDANHPALLEVLHNLQGRRLNNPRIPTMIKGYFEDMNLVLKELAKTCAPGARLAFVVANARFHSELIPVDLLLSELAKDVGFDVERIIITRYKGNSSQQMGRFGRVPVRESILIWRKPRVGPRKAVA